MARRGRPKSNRPAIDLGTPELIRKRMHIAPADATLSTTPLDALKSRGQISDEAYTAACYFHALRKMVFGKAHPAAIDLTAVSSGGMPEELDTATAERRYREACNAVKQQGRQVLDALENLVVHERWPEWMFSGRGKTSPDKNKLMLSLAALLGWYRGRQRAVA